MDATPMRERCTAPRLVSSGSRARPARNGTPRRTGRSVGSCGPRSVLCAYGPNLSIGGDETGRGQMRHGWRHLWVLLFLITATAYPTALSSAVTFDEPAQPELGLASFYALRFQGQETASGRLFDHGQLVAAHRTLPFGSVVRVTNLENGRNVIVRIIDRGPYGRNYRA